MSNWKNAVTVNTAPAAPVEGPRPDRIAGPTVPELHAAAALFDARTDAFAAGNGAVCRDIAARVAGWGYASDKQRDFATKLVEWSLPRPTLPVTMPVNANAILAQSQLRTAATRYNDAGDARKAATCADIADKLARFGSFASEAQQAFALSLVREAPGADVLPPEAGGPAAPDAVPLPTNRLKVHRLFEVMQKHATLHAGDLKISRKNADSMCWLVWGNKAVGKIDGGVATVWFGKAGGNFAAIMAHGKLSGRCCSCGRDLTDPESIERGIGPICAGKF